MRKSRFMAVLLLAVSPVLFSADSTAQGKEAPESMTGLAVGEKVPDFTLKNQKGDDVSLESLLTKDGSTVLVFHRSANW